MLAVSGSHCLSSSSGSLYYFWLPVPVRHILKFSLLKYKTCTEHAKSLILVSLYSFLPLVTTHLLKESVSVSTDSLGEPILFPQECPRHRQQCPCLSCDDHSCPCDPWGLHVLTRLFSWCWFILLCLRKSLSCRSSPPVPLSHPGSDIDSSHWPPCQSRLALGDLFIKLQSHVSSDSQNLVYPALITLIAGHFHWGVGGD